jgi:hypothetical protein
MHGCRHVKVAIQLSMTVLACAVARCLAFWSGMAQRPNMAGDVDVHSFALNDKVIAMDPMNRSDFIASQACNHPLHNTSTEGPVLNGCSNNDTVTSTIQHHHQT